MREVLQLLKQNKWPIAAYLEYEYKGAGTPVEEVKKGLDVHASGARVNAPHRHGPRGPRVRRGAPHRRRAAPRLRGCRGGGCELRAIGAREGRRARRARRRTAATRRSPPIPTCTSSTTPRRTTCTCRSSWRRSTHRKHVISDKPLALELRTTRGRLSNAARRGGRRPCGHLQLSRQSARAAGARDDSRPARSASRTSCTARYLQDWLLQPTDFSWRLEPDKGGESSAIGDIGSHWCDLVQHVVGRRIDAGARRSHDGRDHAVQAVEEQGSLRAAADERGERVSRSRAKIWRRCSCASTDGARGCVCVGQVCAGHKNDLWFEVNGRTARCAGFRSGRTSCGSAAAMAPNARAAEGPVAACTRARGGTRTCLAGTRRHGPTPSAT